MPALKRLAWIASGVDVALLVASFAFSIAAIVFSSAADSSAGGHWNLRRLLRIAEFFAYLSYLLAWMQLLGFIIVCEFGNLRNRFLYVAFCVLLSVILLRIHTQENEFETLKLTTCLLFGFPAAIGGYLYWLIAGRYAGKWREK